MYKALLNSPEFIKPSERQRLEAKQQAREAVTALAGSRPRREDYRGISQTKYPDWLTNTLVALCLIGLVAAFIPSAIRLYTIGSDTFEHGIDSQTLGYIAGGCIVVMSETFAILFAFMLSVIPTHDGGMRWSLRIGMVASATLALSGNFYVAIYEREHNTFFTWLEAVLPPFLTLLTAFILKYIALNAIERRHADNEAYRAALETFEEQIANPEVRKEFTQIYANILYDLLIRINRVAQKRELRALDNANKSALVSAIMASDHWFVYPQGEIKEVVILQPELPPLSNNGFSH